MKNDIFKAGMKAVLLAGLTHRDLLFVIRDIYDMGELNYSPPWGTWAVC